MPTTDAYKLNSLIYANLFISIFCLYLYLRYSLCCPHFVTHTPIHLLNYSFSLTVATFITFMVYLLTNFIHAFLSSSILSFGFFDKNFKMITMYLSMIFFFISIYLCIFIIFLFFNLSFRIIHIFLIFSISFLIFSGLT